MNETLKNLWRKIQRWLVIDELDCRFGPMNWDQFTTQQLIAILRGELK